MSVYFLWNYQSMLSYIIKFCFIEISVCSPTWYFEAIFTGMYECALIGLQNLKACIYIVPSVTSGMST